MSVLNEYFMSVERSLVNKALGVSAAFIANPVHHGNRDRAVYRSGKSMNELDWLGYSVKLKNNYISRETNGRGYFLMTINKTVILYR